MTQVQQLVYTDYRPEIEAALRGHFGNNPHVKAAHIAVRHYYVVTIELDDFTRDILLDAEKNVLDCEYTMRGDMPREIWFDVEYRPIPESWEKIDLENQTQE